MLINKLLGLSILMAFAQSGLSAEPPSPAVAAPTFGKMSSSNRLASGVIRKPQATMSEPPRLTEIRLMPGTDGKLHRICREVPNPRRGETNKSELLDGAQQ